MSDIEFYQTYQQYEEYLSSDSEYKQKSETKVIKRDRERHNLKRKVKMSLIVKDTGSGDFELAPEGNHISGCYMVVDLGIQKTQFGDKHKILIGWELCGELMKDGRPFVASKQYTASLADKANLRHDLEAWRGRKFTDEELQGFDVFAVAGASCMVSVVHSVGEKTYANVNAVTALPKGMTKPVLVNEVVTYSLDNPNPATFGKLPEWIQKKITGQGQAEHPNAPGQLQEGDPGFETQGFDDDIPL